MAQELRQDFQFRDPLTGTTAELGTEMATTQAVCLNVRRTDFLQTAMLNTTNLAYFERAIAYMCQVVEKPHFYVFSDDVAWCEANLKVVGYPLTVVSHRHKGRKFSDYLQLMSLCRHYIIPNSSFAWWATWLNPRPEQIVVAPKNWFSDPTIDTSDLIPQEWIRL
ncbi:MAG: alpha-1,2-fucosyltransferase [Bacteroidetes bacterium]|nr:MAG: alpha-1,2-fucosyltransferase [Bacteroidota bacterium]